MQTIFTFIRKHLDIYNFIVVLSVIQTLITTLLTITSIIIFNSFVIPIITFLIVLVLGFWIGGKIINKLYY